jgi:hypothetical protein
MDIRLGDSRDEVVARFGKPQERRPGDPWHDNEEALGSVIRPEDLAADDDWTGYETLVWHKDQVCAVFKDNIIRALVVRAYTRAQNGRGIRLGDHESKMESLYTEKPEIETVDVPAAAGRHARKSANWIKVYRYNKLGIGFEIRDEKVVSMSLFPVQAE